MDTDNGRTAAQLRRLAALGAIDADTTVPTDADRAHDVEAFDADVAERGLVITPQARAWAEQVLATAA